MLMTLELVIHLPNDVETKVKGENFGLNVKKKETISADEFDDLFDN
jgi:hypothetical protein